MNNITASDWSGAVDLATQHEALYAEIDSLMIEPTDEPVEEAFDEPIDVPIVEPFTEPVQETSTKNELKCENCHFETVLPNAFQNHRKSYIVCYVCAMKFCGKRARRNHEAHIRRGHDFKPKSAFICNVCKKPFGLKSILKTHLKRTKCGKPKLIEHLDEPIYELADEAIEEPMDETIYEPIYVPINEPIIEPVNERIEEVIDEPTG